MIRVRSEKGEQLVRNKKISEITLGWLIKLFPCADHFEVNLFSDPVVVAYEEGGAIGYVDVYNVK